MEKNGKNGRCGCSGGNPEPNDHDAHEKPVADRPVVRRLNTSHEKELVEILVHKDGTQPARVLVAAEEATLELITKLRAELPDLPRLAIDGGKGAVDIRLEDRTGMHVKRGTVMLEGPDGVVPVNIDANTRRFRIGGLTPGRYALRASSAQYGRRNTYVEVRKSDVTRTVIALDGKGTAGSADLNFIVRGVTSDMVHVRITDKVTGREVYNERQPVKDGRVHLSSISFGDLHFNITDDTGATSCYDTDVSDSGLIPPFEVELDPRLVVGPDPGPDPIDDPFFGMSRQFSGLTRILPGLGINSLSELASVEGEDLMHRARNLKGSFGLAIPNPVFGAAILEARAHAGAVKASGPQQILTPLAGGAAYQRSFLPAAVGVAEFTVNLAKSQTAELLITTSAGEERHKLHGTQTITTQITRNDVEGERPISMRLINTSDSAGTFEVAARFPASEFGVSTIFNLPNTRDNITGVYQAWAAANPGVDPTIVDTSLDPENIRGWIEQARTFFAHTGVCSINDLGKFRMDPMGVLHGGAYIAPRKPPMSISSVAVLEHYAFSEIINSSIVYYRPNDTLHDTAIVMAGAWDIRGQSVVIGQEVRELVVIAGSILHDGGSSITWEHPALPTAFSYVPSKAANGSNGSVAGERGHDGEPGDPDPHPARNGGGDANTPAPVVTLYLLDATNNLPTILLRGQDGGVGGQGEDGGNGGNGSQGEHADSHFFSGCCREVGFGGDGGNGGNAGGGGRGGRGGQGGRMTLLTTDASIAVLAGDPPTVDINPGDGGPGGNPGSPGTPGTGGPAGSADCELWCDDHDERHGNDGSAGADGINGRTGDTGSPPLTDSLQIYPITLDQWNAAFNNPHILQMSPIDVEPGEAVTITGQNFMPGNDKVFFDGLLQGDATATVSSSTSATFTVPMDADGGIHPVLIRPTGVTSRRSNRVMVRVIPVLDAIAAGTRWTESQTPSLTGLAFASGCKVIAEDWAVAGHPAVNITVTSNTRTNIDLQIPPAPLSNLRGVRRIRVRNPDGGTSRAERTVRISDTIVVPVAAFRVLGTTPGIGTSRSAADISSLFTEASGHSINVPWAAARISFQLAQPVVTINVADDNANIWPLQVIATDQAAFAAAPGVLGALNIFFVRDVQIATAYSYFGGGPIICGDNAGDLSIEHLEAIAAHEAGHSLCLRHVCDGAGEGPGTFFNRTCQGGDDGFLMFPFWNTQTALNIPAGQVNAARFGATHLEEGKTTVLSLASIFQTNVPAALPVCQTADAE